MFQQVCKTIAAFAFYVLMLCACALAAVLTIKFCLANLTVVLPSVLCVWFVVYSQTEGPRLTLRLSVWWLFMQLAVVYLGSVCAFALAYWIPSQLLSLPTVVANGDPIHEFQDCLYFSVTTLTSLGFGDLQPVGYGRLIAGIEVIFGLLLTGMGINEIFDYRSRQTNREFDKRVVRDDLGRLIGLCNKLLKLLRTKQPLRYAVKIRETLSLVFESSDRVTTHVFGDANYFERCQKKVASARKGLKNVRVHERPLDDILPHHIEKATDAELKNMTIASAYVLVCAEELAELFWPLKRSLRSQAIRLIRKLTNNKQPTSRESTSSPIDDILTSETE